MYNGIVEKKRETTMVYFGGYSGIIENRNYYLQLSAGFCGITFRVEGSTILVPCLEPL